MAGSDAVPRQFWPRRWSLQGWGGCWKRPASPQASTDSVMWGVGAPGAQPGPGPAARAPSAITGLFSAEPLLCARNWNWRTMARTGDPGGGSKTVLVSRVRGKRRREGGPGSLQGNGALQRIGGSCGKRPSAEFKGRGPPGPTRFTRLHRRSGASAALHLFQVSGTRRARPAPSGVSRPEDTLCADPEGKGPFREARPGTLLPEGRFLQPRPRDLCPGALLAECRSRGSPEVAQPTPHP